MTQKVKEQRFYNTDLKIEERSDAGADTVGTISGYAAVFNSLSEDLGRFREKIAYGAFSDSVNNDVRALWSHNPDIVLGRTSANTLKLKEDNVGLAFELSLPNTQMGRDALTSIKRRDITGMSFGFVVQEDSWQRGKAGEPHVRTLLKINLFEISPVAFPAYPATQVSSRAVDEMLKEIETKWAYEEQQANGHLVEGLKPKVLKLTLGARFGL